MLRFLGRHAGFAGFVATSFVATVATGKQGLAKFYKPSVRTDKAHADSMSAYKEEMARTGDQCFLEVYVTPTNEQNGPGHVSTSMIVVNKAGETKLLGHTSFMPIAGGGLVNAPLLGAVPVPAHNFDPQTIRQDDVGHAEQIIRIPVSWRQLKRGVDEQVRIAQAVDEGRYMYSVVGGTWGITLGLAALSWAYQASVEAVAKHEKEEGFLPTADPNDMLLLMSAAEEKEERAPSDVLNCTAAAEAVVRAATDCDAIEGSILPASLGTNILEELSGIAVEVDDSLIPVERPAAEEESVFSDEPPAPS